MAGKRNVVVSGGQQTGQNPYQNIDDLLKHAQEHLRENNTDTALSEVDQILGSANDEYPQMYKVYYLKGRLAQQSKDIDTAEKLYKKSIDLYSDFAPAHRNLARLLRDKKEFTIAEAHYHKAVQLDPYDYTVYFELASFYLMTERRSHGEAILRECLRLNPDYRPARRLFNYVFNKKQLITRLERQLKTKPDDGRIAYDLALLYEFQGDLKTSMEYFKNAMKTSFSVSTAMYNHFGLLMMQLDVPFKEVIAVFNLGIRKDNTSYQLYNSMASCYFKENQWQAARLMLKKSLEIQPKQTISYLNLGYAERNLNEYQKAIDAFESCLRLDPDEILALSAILDVAKETCNWGVVDKYFPQLMQVTDNLIAKNKRVNWNPILVTQYPVSNEQYVNIVKSYNAKFNQKKYDAYRPTSGKSRKIRIAYISPDFIESHRVGFLVDSIFSLHDSSVFETFGYSLRSALVKTPEKIRQSFHHFESLSKMNPIEAAEKIHEDGIDILIDLSGHARKGGYEILAAQPAPIQINYLGNAASAQADFIQYFISSKEVVPDTLEKYFSEKLIYMPEGCYSTSPREISGTQLKRKDFGLPEDGVVFCCFSYVRRIDQAVFESWMHILNKVPDSVLWMYEENEEMKGRLLSLASKMGVEKSRIIFKTHTQLTGDRSYQLADLWLDTFTVSAGIGSVLCANVGLPVLTLVGETPQSRVGVGVAAAMNTKEMICNSVKDYEKKAIALGNHPKKLKKLKEKLIANRSEIPLFNPERFVHHLEMAYQSVWENYLDKNEPKTITVKRMPVK